MTKYMEGLAMSAMECHDCGLEFEDDLLQDNMSCPECGSFNVGYTDDDDFDLEDEE